MTTIQLIKKSVFKVTMAIFSGTLLVSLMLNAAIYIGLSEKLKNSEEIHRMEKENIIKYFQLQLEILLSQAQEDRKQIQELTAILKNSEENSKKLQATLNKTKTKLDNALIPESTFKEAASEKVVKPVKESATQLWISMKENYNKARSYVFE